MLDHTSYPHIVERIARFAPLELRSTSRNWNSYVDLECLPHWRLELDDNGRLTPYVCTTERVKPTGALPLPPPASSGLHMEASKPTPADSSEYAVDLTHTTRHIRIVDVVSSGPMDLEPHWHTAFPHLEAVRYFSSPVSANSGTSCFHAPLAIAFTKYRSLESGFTLPDRVEELIINVGPPLPCQPEINNRSFPFTRSLPSTVKKLTILLGDLTNWGTPHPLSLQFDSFHPLFLALSGRIALQDLAFTVVGDPSILSGMGITSTALQRMCDRYAWSYPHLLQMVIQFGRGLPQVLNASPEEARSILLSLPALLPFDDSLVRCMSEEEWRSEVGEHKYRLATDDKYPGRC